jgi:O-antigen ligase
MNTRPSTAASRTAAANSAATRRVSFGDVAFVLFLLLIFVTLKPFATRDPAALAFGAGTGEGDMWRQVTFLGAFALILLAAWRELGARAFFAISPAMSALLAWCLFTSIWAFQSDVTFRRAGLEVVIVLSAMVGVQTVGVERALQLLRYVLAGAVILSWISIPLIPQAVHLANEPDPGIVGDWRGLYFHKNIAGAVCAITAILHFFEARKSGRKWDWFVLVAACGFLVETHSKTSMGLLPVAVVAGLLYPMLRGRALERWILLIVAALAITAALCALAIDFSAVVHFFSDPTKLTGRVAIWTGEIAFIRDHPFLGYGFGTFADSGALSPLHNYVADSWVQNEAHGHNSYLQLLVTIGGVGFVLAMIAFVVQPMMEFSRIADAGRYAPMFAIFVFSIMHNFVESDFLEGDGQAWVAFLIVLASLRTLPQVQLRPAPKPVPTSAPQWLAP